MHRSFRNSVSSALLVALFGFSAPTFANPLEGMPDGQYQLDPAHASVLWKVSHLGFSTYVGRFNTISADLALRSNEFTQSTARVEIAVNSLDTDYPFPEKDDFNKKLSTEWFKSAEFPTITFVSKKVGPLSEDKHFTIDGDLTLLGQTHPVTLQAKLNRATPKHPFTQKPLIGFSATTRIDRTVWGLSNHAPAIGAEVKIEIEGEFAHNTQP